MGSGCTASELREKPLCYYVTEKNRVLRPVNLVQQSFWGAAPRHFGSGTGQFWFYEPQLVRLLFSEARLPSIAESILS